MIRKATTSDSAEIASIIVNTWKTAYTGIIDHNYIDSMSLDKFNQIMKENIDQKKEDIFVYEKDKKARGFISSKMSNESPVYNEVIGFYILPQYQNHGIGGKLFNYIKTYSLKNNMQKIILWTLKGAKNNSFYKSHGGEIFKEERIDIGNKNYPGVCFIFNLKQDDEF